MTELVTNAWDSCIVVLQIVMMSEMHFENICCRILILIVLFRGVSQEKDGQISSAIVSSVQSKITQVQIDKLSVLLT